MKVGQVGFQVKNEAKECAPGFVFCWTILTNSLLKKKNLRFHNPLTIDYPLHSPSSYRQHTRAATRPANHRVLEAQTTRLTHRASIKAV